MGPTQGRSEQPMDHDVGVASDGRGEVRVQRNVEGVVLKKFFLAERSGAEVECHLGEKLQLKSSSPTRDSAPHPSAAASELSPAWVWSTCA